MIGDHEQLRPKVDNYELVRSKHFDLSAFERLSNNSLLSASLHMQSRMRREFTELLHGVYPDLLSHPRVDDKEHTSPACLLHSMFFWTHSFPEQFERSCSNEQEAQMVITLAKWMVKEGTNPAEITIIAMYSAQVKLLRGMVRDCQEFMSAPRELP
eukprot:5451649-Prymnesium_polylepis.1